jgi:hypothetical protein
LNEGKLWVHKGSCGLDRGKLGKTKALGLACEDDGDKATRESSMQMSRKDASDGKVPVDLSRIIVTVSMEQP